MMMMTFKRVSKNDGKVKDGINGRSGSRRKRNAPKT